MDKPSLVLICTGLGRVHRGFETYISQLGEKLSYECSADFDTLVLTGGNFSSPHFRTRRIASVSRNASWLKPFVKDIHRLFRIEQQSFFVGLIPFLLRQKPDVLYLGEYRLYCYLVKLRRLLGLQYKLVLYTGGQAIPGPHDPTKDFVHHVTDVYVAELNSRGYPANRQFLLPHFIDTGAPADDELYQEIRQKAGGRQILLAVGSLDNKVKRMAWLAESLRGTDNIFPIFLGNATAETDLVGNTLKEIFGEEGFLMKKVSPADLPAYYAAADLFVLASAYESFGLVLLEAMLAGKPVACQPYPAAGFVVNGHAHYLPAEQPDQWQDVISNLLRNDPYPVCRLPLRQHAMSFGWAQLGDRYKAMFRRFLSVSG